MDLKRDAINPELSIPKGSIQSGHFNPRSPYAVCFQFQKDQFKAGTNQPGGGYVILSIPKGSIQSLTATKTAAKKYYFQFQKDQFKAATK